jgi:RimJ/RimL family protein N-acetyltransferase
MPPGQQTVKLLETKEIERFIPIMREIDFGDKFLLSMLHWCGIGRRSTPLDYWQVFLIQAHSEIVGVSGLYRQPAMALAACWLGWFAIRPGFRRQRFGTAAIVAVCDFARNLDFKELWVYTDAANDVAIKFYTRLNFELLGAARDCAPGKTMADSDIVLRQTLSVPG